MKWGFSTGIMGWSRPGAGGEVTTGMRIVSGHVMAALLWVVSGGAGAAAAEGAEASRNVLLIISDDLNRHLGCYGNTIVQTPNIDRLAARGVRFEHAYCQYPVCNPSRASFLTGLRPDATRVFDGGTHFRTNLAQAVTLPQLFKQHGYFTARVGKVFHYNVPHDIGTSGLDDPRSWNEVVNPSGRDVQDYGNFRLVPKGAQVTIADLANWFTSGYASGGADEEQTDGKVAQESIRLLEKNRGRPFFLAVGFFRPHVPFVAPKRYYDMYPVEGIRLPECPADDRNDIPKAALWVEPPNFGLATEECRRAIRSYYAAISFMDAQLGRILDAMDRLELWENTLVVFLGVDFPRKNGQ